MAYVMDARPSRVNEGREVALIRFFKRFPQGSHLGFEKWRHIAEKDAAPALDAKAELVYSSDFGAALFNLVTGTDFPFKRRLYFSGRAAVTMAMIKAMLVAQKKYFDRGN